MAHDEILDIVDENDEVIGTATRKEVYEKKYCRRIVHVIIINDKNEILLQKRAKHLSFAPLYWTTSASGHVLSGDTYEAAAYRELQEEVGIKPDKLFFLRKELYKDQNNQHGFLAFFVCRYNGPFKVDFSEVAEVTFFSLKTIKDMITNKEKIHQEFISFIEKHSTELQNLHKF